MTTFYIDPNGSDSTGDGSEGNPWQTLMYAIDNTSGTSEIIANDGEYTETLDSDNVDFSNRIIRSKNNNPENCVFNFENVICERLRASEFCKILGITFLNMVPALGNRPIFRLFDAELIDNCIFKNCYISQSSAGRAGLMVESDVKINACIFIDCYAQSANTARGLFGGNNVNRDYTITIENCVIYYSGTIPPNFQLPDHISYVTLGTGLVVTNFKNNIFSIKNDTLGSNAFKEEPGVTYNVSHSCIHNGNYIGEDPSVITEDPLLVSPETNDFRLRPNSPCIGTGSL
jgi:hypothetical protein